MASRRSKSSKKTRKRADIPVIMLTAKAQDADVFRGWQSGADLYLTKPFNPAELISFVKRLLTSQETAAEKTYSIDDLMDEADESLVLPPGE